MEYWTFDELKKYAYDCFEVWVNFKNSFNDEKVKAFLKRSYPVICAKVSQLEIHEVNPITIASKAPAIIVKDKAGRAFIDLYNAYDATDDKTPEKQKLKERLEKYNTDKLLFYVCRLEVRFATLNMKIIQLIKQSVFVDQEATMLSPASIRVFLKTN